MSSYVTYQLLQLDRTVKCVQVFQSVIIQIVVFISVESNLNVSAVRPGKFNLKENSYY